MSPLFLISSGPNDHVFVNFVDHGAPGLIAFPDGEVSPMLSNVGRSISQWLSARLQYAGLH